MACFAVPAAEAAIVTVANLILDRRAERAAARGEVRAAAASGEGAKRLRSELKSLSRLLWGGSALLAFEHLWHGEIQPFPPFLTAASDPEALAEVWREMATVGTSMALFVTLSWAAVCVVRRRLADGAPHAEPSAART